MNQNNNNEKRVIICCEVLQHELKAALKASGTKAEIVILRGKLHDQPGLLRDEVQKEIDKHQDAAVIFLSYGRCGNGLIGITASHCTIAAPRTEDCIHALLYNNPELEKMRSSSYFSSKGWKTQQEDSELTRMIKKYGESRARRMYKTMYKNYTNLVYMHSETGEGDEDAYIEESKQFADYLELNFLHTDADFEIFTEMLNENYDARHIVKQKGEVITAEDFDYS